jgi:hypothetical protein
LVERPQLPVLKIFGLKTENSLIQSKSLGLRVTSSRSCSNASTVVKPSPIEMFGCSNSILRSII